MCLIFYSLCAVLCFKVHKEKKKRIFILINLLRELRIQRVNQSCSGLKASPRINIPAVSPAPDRAHDY